MKIIGQSALIIVATALVFAVNNTALKDFQAQVFAFVVVIWLSTLILNKLFRKNDFFTGSYFDLFSIILSLLLLIFVSGGLASPIFFLVYFLLFAVTFMLEPIIIFVFTASLLGLFAQEFQQDIIFNSLRLGSLLLLSPLAFIFGLENKKREKLTAQIEDNATKIIEDTENILACTTTSTTRQNAEEIQEIAKRLRKKVKSSR
jgi:hypothetical protein